MSHFNPFDTPIVTNDLSAEDADARRQLSQRVGGGASQEPGDLANI